MEFGEGILDFLGFPSADRKNRAARDSQGRIRKTLDLVEIHDNALCGRTEISERQQECLQLALRHTAFGYLPFILINKNNMVVRNLNDLELGRFSGNQNRKADDMQIISFLLFV
jgi:hypothetical protein